MKTLVFLAKGFETMDFSVFIDVTGAPYLEKVEGYSCDSLKR